MTVVAATPPPTAADYPALYADYWSRADRWGTSSFPSADMLAHQVLVTCGPGSILDAGCGMGELVRALLASGIDARGVDIASRPIAHAEALTPGRFSCASILNLPFEDGAFETVVCTDCLEHLAEADVPRAIAEIARVARRSIFLTIGTRRDRDGRWHLTIQDRAWWERKLFAAGLRKHPGAPGIQPFESFETEGPSITVVMEKVPAEAALEFPLQSLRDGRDLHMDMLRESGRRSDAHIARYAYAARFVRRGDVVLDAACGLGYGAAVLSRLSDLGRAVGIDSDPAAVRYAQANFGPTDPRCEFRVGDCQDLSAIPDASIDMVVSFETLEHIADPERFLAHVRRVLRPGGRFIASVPNEWTDQSGADPNPHHLHVYTWDRLAAEVMLEGGLILERACAQTAGGGMKLGDQPRRMTDLRVDPDGQVLGGRPAPAEWWIAVAMKPAIGEPSRVDFTTHRPERGQSDDFNPVSFGAEYADPWLGDAMVMIGHRATERTVLERTARAVLASAVVDTPDHGAALCVLAYQMLESPQRPAAEIEAVLAMLAAFDAAVQPATPHRRRWLISNRFVTARLLLALGRHEEARAAFLRCAEIDPLPFSPLLASKTVEALFHAGLLAAGNGDFTEARACWERGLAETRRALGADWRQVWDSPANPAPFAMPEVAVIADHGAMCAAAINGVAAWTDRPGRVWRSLRAGTKADLRSWIAHLEQIRPVVPPPPRPTPAEAAIQAADNARDAAERQAINWKAAAEHRDGIIAELKSWNEQQGQARKWLEGQVANWRGEAERRAEAIGHLKTWTDQLAAGKAWLDGQLNSARERAEAAAARIAEAEAAVSRAAAAEADAVARMGQRAVEHGAEVTRLQTAIGDAHEVIRLLREQVATLKADLKQREAQIRAMQTPSGVLRTGAAVVLRAGRPPRPTPGAPAEPPPQVRK